MTKGKYETASMDDILKAVDWKERYKERVVEVDIPFLERSLEFRAPTRDEFIRFFDELGIDTESQCAAYAHLIYDKCGLLHDKELHELLEIKDPYDVVEKLFSVQTILEIGQKLNIEFDINKTDKAERLKKPSTEETPT